MGFLMAAAAYCLDTAWNAMTAFNAIWLPVFFAPGHGLPFKQRINGTGNTTEARNTAVVMALYRTCNAFVPECNEDLDPLMEKWGVNTSYLEASDLTNPMDIGNAVGNAMIAHAAQ
eukprot:gene23344-30593_t